MADERPTVLVIDNDEGMVRALEARLDAAGYRCRTACSGAQGIAIFQEDRVDLVITDLNMPGGDGIAVARAVRSSSPIPIIVVTGFRPDFRRDLRGLTNITVLEKPFASAALYELVEAELMLSSERLAA